MSRPRQGRPSVAVVGFVLGAGVVDVVVVVVVDDVVVDTVVVVGTVLMPRFLFSQSTFEGQSQYWPLGLYTNFRGQDWICNCLPSHQTNFWQSVGCG